MKIVVFISYKDWKPWETIRWTVCSILKSPVLIVRLIGSYVVAVMNKTYETPRCMGELLLHNISNIVLESRTRIFVVGLL